MSTDKNEGAVIMDYWSMDVRSSVFLCCGWMNSSLIWNSTMAQSGPYLKWLRYGPMCQFEVFQVWFRTDPKRSQWLKKLSGFVISSLLTWTSWNFFTKVLQDCQIEIKLLCCLFQISPLMISQIQTWAPAEPIQNFSGLLVELLDGCCPVGRQIILQLSDWGVTGIWNWSQFLPPWLQSWFYLLKRCSTAPGTPTLWSSASSLQNKAFMPSGGLICYRNSIKCRKTDDVSTE